MLIVYRSLRVKPTNHLTPSKDRNKREFFLTTYMLLHCQAEKMMHNISTWEHFFDSR